MDMAIKLTSVIPTKNRPSDLIKAVTSILAQTRLPDELIIVDQSPDNDSRHMVEVFVTDQGFNKLIYIHDAAISGLVDAKRVASERATGDIVCFLEDDVILAPFFIEQILFGFETQNDMIGCCGVVTNLPRQQRAYEFLFHLFHRGIFRDIRVGLYGRLNGFAHKLIASDKLSGGLSAWRREVFAAVPFDVANGFHMLEDIDFSTRVAKHYGSRLYINPNARLEHHSSPFNREVLAPRQRRKLIEYIIYYKKRRDWPGATFALPWLLLGLFVESLFQAFSSRSVGCIRGFFSGVRQGFARKITR